MKAIVDKLSYSNVVATIALFVALGGASYAAVQIPNGSVGPRQLKREAVTRAKIAEGAVTRQKIRDGAITGSKVDASTLGTVPSAVHSIRSDLAHDAWRATHATRADLASDTYRLGGVSSDAYGAYLVSRTEIPATDTDAEWWIPVSGRGEVRSTRQEVEMITPASSPQTASRFSVFAREAPGFGAAARVEVQLHNNGFPLPWSLPVTPGFDYWPAGHTIELDGGAILAIKVIQEPNGEEIPAMSVQTALMLGPTP